jgi:hypothetical protein
MDTNEKDFDKMSDEEFMNIVENIDSYADNENEENDNVEDTDLDNEESENIENESEEESEEIEEPEENSEEIDEPKEETNIEDNEDQEENAQEDQEESNEEAKEETSSKDANEKSNKEIEDYKKAYEELMQEKAKYENFYNQVTSEFVANGKVMKGFDDPKKIIRSQQMAAGFSEKMKAFKKYKPFINPLIENGLIDNPDKFNLAINAVSGDVEALKTLIQEAKIDPVELDMENINYEPKNQIASDIEIAFEDVIETADQYGVRDKVESVIGNDWDDNSVIELLEDSQNSADLINHISTGVYDMVQQRIAEKKMTDPYGAFSQKRSIDQYREAASELEQEYLQYLNSQQQQEAQDAQQQYQDPYAEINNTKQFSEEEIQAEIERIKQEKYSEKIKRNEEVDKARRKAASVSKKKPRSKSKKEAFDPGKLSDAEFEDLLNSLITQ